jgi:hypothetical protein
VHSSGCYQVASAIEVSPSALDAAYAVLPGQRPAAMGRLSSATFFACLIGRSVLSHHRRAALVLGVLPLRPGRAVPSSPGFPRARGLSHPRDERLRAYGPTGVWQCVSDLRAAPTRTLAAPARAPRPGLGGRLGRSAPPGGRALHRGSPLPGSRAGPPPGAAALRRGTTPRRRRG